MGKKPNTTDRWHSGLTAFIMILAAVVLVAGNPVTAGVHPVGEECSRTPKETEARPESKIDTISYGNALCNVRLHLVEHDDVFSTYVPDEIEEKWTVTADGASAWFFAAFGGTVRHNTYLHLYFPAEEKTAGDLRNLIAAGDGFGRSVGLELTPDAVPDDSDIVDAFRFRAFDENGLSEGFIHIVDYGTCPFIVMVSCPQEYTDTFLPRVQRILSEIRWKNGGAMGGNEGETLELTEAQELR
jgi:hypothetical protein